jgi:dihydropteroate synthase
MGVLNVTPDSFFDGGWYLTADAAVARGTAILDEGADILDVGGESTRPGAPPVGADEELGRVIPVIERLAADERVASGAVRISIDTRTAEVARSAIAAGARMINDVSASSDLAEIAAQTGTAYVAMHSLGIPADVHGTPVYGDVVAEVSEYLLERARAAERAGVAEVMVDPGIGYSKTAAHNLALLRAMDRIVALGWPVLVGVSRKRFVGAVAAGGVGAEPLPASERFEGSLACAVWSMVSGAACVRVHDVRATVEAARLIEATGTAGAAGRQLLGSRS